MDIKLMSKEDLGGVDTFLSEMFSDWIDMSSLQNDAICCPSRKVKDVLERFSNSLDDPTLDVILAKEGGKVIGTLVLDYKPVWLKAAKGELLNTDPSHRGKGVATAIIGYAIEVLRKNNIKKLILETWYGNDPALNLFKNMGAVITCVKEGKTVTTENWMPMIMGGDQDGSMLGRVAAGKFRAESILDNGLINVDVKVGDESYEYTVVRM